MNKKTVLTAISVILVLALSLGGTLAYFQNSTTPKTNEFVIDSVSVALDETDGTYRVIPGMTQKKDPVITVSSTLPSWVFLKVEETNNDDSAGNKIVTFAIDSTWKQLKDANGAIVPGIYYYDVAAENGTGETPVALNVLADQKVSYASNLQASNLPDPSNVDLRPELTFTGYIIQKYRGGEIDGTVINFSPAEAWAVINGQELSPASYTASGKIDPNGTGDLVITTSGDAVTATVPKAAAVAQYDTLIAAAATAGNLDAEQVNQADKEVVLNLTVEKTGERSVGDTTTVDFEIDMAAVTTITLNDTVLAEKTSTVSAISDYTTIVYTKLGAGKNVTGMTHNSNLMGRLSSADATLPEEGDADYNENGYYYYDPFTGVLTIRTKTFSPFAITFKTTHVDFSNYLGLSSPDGVDILPNKYDFGMKKDDVLSIINGMTGETSAARVAALNNVIHGGQYEIVGDGFDGEEDATEDNDKLWLLNARRYTAKSKTAYLDQENGQYQYYHADFVVSFNKPITGMTNDSFDNGIILCGEYGDWGWLKIPCPVDLAAKQEYRLLKDFTNGAISINYEELCETVKQFTCGAIYVKDNYNSSDPLEMTIELRLYETMTPEEASAAGYGNTVNGETGVYITVDTYTYTFN